MSWFLITAASIAVEIGKGVLVACRGTEQLERENQAFRDEGISFTGVCAGSASSAMYR